MNIGKIIFIVYLTIGTIFGEDISYENCMSIIEIPHDLSIIRENVGNNNEIFGITEKNELLSVNINKMELKKFDFNNRTIVNYFFDDSQNIIINLKNSIIILDNETNMNELINEEKYEIRLIEGFKNPEYYLYCYIDQNNYLIITKSIIKTNFNEILLKKKFENEIIKSALYLNLENNTIISILGDKILYSFINFELDFQLNLIKEFPNGITFDLFLTKESCLFLKIDDINKKSQIIQLNNDIKIDNINYVNSNNIVLYNVNQSSHTILYSHNETILSFLSLSQSKFIFSSIKKLIIMDLKSKIPFFSLKYENSSNLICFILIRDLIIGLKKSQIINIWEIASQNQIYIKELNNLVNITTIFQIEANIIGLQTNGNIHIFSIDNNKIINIIKSITVKKLSSFEFNGYLISFCEKNIVKLWNFHTGFIIWQKQFENDLIEIIVQKNSLNYIVFICFSTEIHIYKIRLNLLKEPEYLIHKDFSSFGKIYQITSIFQKKFISVSFFSGDFIIFHFSHDPQPEFTIMKQEKLEFPIELIIKKNEKVLNYVLYNTSKKALEFLDINFKYEFKYPLDFKKFLIKEIPNNSSLLLYDGEKLGIITKYYVCNCLNICFCDNDKILNNGECIDIKNLNTINNKSRSKKKQSFTDALPYMLIIIFSLVGLGIFRIYTIKSTEKALIDALDKNK